MKKCISGQCSKTSFGLILGYERLHVGDQHVVAWVEDP